MMIKPYLYVAAAGLVAVSYVATYLKGHSDGKELIQSRWDRAEASMLSKSIEARDEAEGAIPPLPPPDRVVPPPKPCRVPDKHDRDCG